MKKLIGLLILVSCFAVNGYAQSDKRLTERLDSVLALTQKGDIDKLLDFTYPKLFTIAPRDALKEVMENSFHAENFDISLDSVLLEHIFPLFSIGDAKYAKVLHTMLMRMKFKDEMSAEEAEDMVSSMKESLATDAVRFDKSTNTLIARKLATVVAIKDEHSPEWSFVNYDENSPVAEMLFSKEVIEKLRQYSK